MPNATDSGREILRRFMTREASRSVQPCGKIRSTQSLGRSSKLAGLRRCCRMMMLMREGSFISATRPGRKSAGVSTVIVQDASKDNNGAFTWTNLGIDLGAS